jgi:hypothetical protein
LSRGKIHEICILFGLLVDVTRTTKEYFTSNLGFESEIPSSDLERARIDIDNFIIDAIKRFIQRLKSS